MVTEVVPFGSSEAHRVLELAAAVERLSEHHLGKAVVEEADNRGLDVPVATALKNRRGRGAVAQVGGEPVAVGRLELVAEQNGPAPSAGESARVETLRQEGRTVMFVSGGGQAGAIAIEDQVRAAVTDKFVSAQAEGRV